MRSELRTLNGLAHLKKLRARVEYGDELCDQCTQTAIAVISAQIGRGKIVARCTCADCYMSEAAALNEAMESLR